MTAALDFAAFLAILRSSRSFLSGQRLNHGLSRWEYHEHTCDCKWLRGYPWVLFHNIYQDGFSSIYWRIYTEEPGITNNPSEAPNNGHTILKHLSRLKDLELRLRNLDCLASCYPRRLGLWVFSATPNFDNLAPLYPNESKDESNKLLVGSTTLKGLLASPTHKLFYAPHVNYSQFRHLETLRRGSW